MLARCRVHEVSQEWGCEWGSSYMNESIHSVSSHDCRFLRSRMRCSSLLITPQWLINLILFVVTPLVYRRALQVLADLSPETALGKRLRVDETGVYEIIRTCAGQRAAHPTPQRLQST